MKAYNDIIVAFHEGRGGRYHNPGHLKYLPDVKCLQDLYDDSLYIVDTDQDDNKLPIEEHVLLDSGGNEILHGKDIYEKTGVLGIDGQYDSYYVFHLDEMPERFEGVMANEVKNGISLDEDTKHTIVEYLAEQGYEKADILMDEDTKEIYEGLSKFVDDDDPIDPYTFRVEELDENDEARLMKFEYDGIESCCLVYEDGTIFTPYDWQSRDYPTSIEDVEDCKWMDYLGMGTIILNGLPRSPLLF